MEEKIKEVLSFMKEKGVDIETLNTYNNEILKKDFYLIINGVFKLHSAIIIMGKVESGYLCNGMNLILIGEKTKHLCTCAQIKKHQQSVDACRKGDFVTIEIKGVDMYSVKVGMSLKSFF